jgi:NAD(P)-dependent dehydrogenase (short-subunit alcohol dehydrogenase family)
MNCHGTTVPQPAVAVTGASTGIGKAIALALDAHGFRVFAGVRKEADGLALSREARHGLTPVLLDVTDEAAIRRAVETIGAQTQGQLHGLVNNAGVGLGGPLELVPITRTRELFEVNVIGLLAVTKAFLPLLRKARGRVVNIGSLAGILAMPGASPCPAQAATPRRSSRCRRSPIHCVSNSSRLVSG